MDFQAIKEKLFPKNESAADSKNKKMIILMPVLVVVFIFVISRAVKQPAKCSASVTLPAQKTAEPNNAAKVNWPVPDVYPKNLRDPMQASCSAEANETSVGGSVVVKGIIFSIDRPAAVIDNKIMHQGDKVAGATVVKINKKDVEFEMNGKTWTQEVQQ
jgi:type II secretory pathway component PulC